MSTMGCRNREYEMSLSLDGRLPSGQRASLLGHIAECADCATTWEEMKKAQDLALGLPSPRVRPGFREDLQRRIESGEAAPDVVLHEPIPPFAKVRYLATGAAAAALLITVVNMFAGEAPSTPNDPDSIASTDLPGVPLTPRSIDRGIPASTQWQPVSEFALAKNTADSCANYVQELRDRVQSLGGRPLRQEDWQQLEGVLTNYRTAVGVMRWLDNKRFVRLPGELRAEFQEADRSVAEIFGTKSLEVRRKHLQRLPNFRLERVREGLSIDCCRSIDDLSVELEELVKVMPDAGRVLQFQVVNPNNMDLLRELEVQRTPGAGNRMLFLRVKIEQPQARKQRSGGQQQQLQERSR